MDALQQLYDSEINFTVSTFWDGGFDWKLGDEMNGFKATGCEDNIHDVLIALADAAVKHYPTSDFAKWHRSN